MPLESWSHILVLERDLPMLRALPFTRCVRVLGLSDEQQSAFDRLAEAGLVTVDGDLGRLSERGYRLALAEPWYVGGGVAFFWYGQLVFESRAG